MPHHWYNVHRIWDSILHRLHGLNCIHIRVSHGVYQKAVKIQLKKENLALPEILL